MAKTASGKRRPRKGTYGAEAPGQDIVLRCPNRIWDVVAMGSDAPATHMRWLGTGVHDNRLFNAVEATHVGTKTPIPSFLHCRKQSVIARLRVL